jgi:GAF domain-containing protein
MSELLIDHSLEAHQRGLDLLAVVNKLSHSAATELELLQAAAQPLQRFAQADHVGIARIHEVAVEMSLIAEHPVTPLLGVRLPSDDTSFLALMRRTRAELIVEDVAGSPLINEEQRALLQQIGTYSLILLPLLNEQGELFASIGFDYLAPGKLPDDVRMQYLRLAAEQIAANALLLRLKAQNERYTQQLRKINEFAQRIAPDTPLERALKDVIDAALTLEPFDYVAVYLRRPGMQYLQRFALWQGGITTVTPEGLPLSEDRYTPYQEAFMNAASVLVQDLAASTLWHYPEAEGVRTLAAYPLITQGGAFGVLELGSAQPYAYPALTFDILQQFSSETALLISGVLAYLQAQNEITVKAQASELTAMIQQQTEMTAVIQTTLKSLTTAFGARRARIRLGAPAQDKS